MSREKILTYHSTGIDGIVKKIRDRVGTENPVYLSIDIDTIDPACEYNTEGHSEVNNYLTLTSCSRPRYRYPGDWRLEYP